VSFAPEGPSSPGPKQDDWIIRPASNADNRLVASLLAGAVWKHQHLDWFSALELLGSAPYYVALRGGRPIACLACPPDVQEVSWLRLFAVSPGQAVEPLWNRLWAEAAAAARGAGAQTAAALPTMDWMPALLERAAFQKTNEVIFLEREGPPPAHRASPASVRPFRRRDVPGVAEIDHRAFGPLWQLSPKALEAALRQASVGSVAEAGGKILGYQICTGSGIGAHLARLAVDPPFQRNGIGALLVADALRSLDRHGIRRVSVNTQADNHPSLRLYDRLGFAPAGQAFPVYTLEL
jgi:ribosomal protein S18 acetylase RimI-like enzyme